MGKRNGFLFINMIFLSFSLVYFHNLMIYSIFLGLPSSVFGVGSLTLF